jgi:hypothetical protein
VAQALRKVGVDALVFFLGRNGKREDLSLRQALKILHGRSVEYASLPVYVHRNGVDRREADTRRSFGARDPTARHRHASGPLRCRDRPLEAAIPISALPSARPSSAACVRAHTPQAASPYDAKLVSIYFTNSSMTNVTANAEA